MTETSTSPGGQVQAAIGQILRWASRADVRRALAGDAGRDLSPTDFWLLRAIIDEGPVRVTDLAAWQGVDKSTVTPQVRRLENQQLILREPDPGDRRAALLHATARGRTIVDGQAAAGAEVFDAILGDWPAADRESLGVLLGRLAEEVSSGPARREQGTSTDLPAAARPADVVRPQLRRLGLESADVDHRAVPGSPAPPGPGPAR